MTIFYLPVLIGVIFDVIYISYAITHWILNEEGRIQAKYDSIYSLKRPHDLVAFLKQEELAKNAASHLDKMIQQKAEIDKKWSTISSPAEVEEYLSTFDEDCSKAKNSGEETDLLMSVVDYGFDKGHSLDLLDDKDIRGNANLNCKNFFKLDFSMTIYPHLKILSGKWPTTWPREKNIELPFTMKQMHYGLKKNKTDWYLYNLASLYWRNVGNSQKSLDCIKRAIHFAPRRYKDTPLFNLGVLLHRAQRSSEAVIVLHSAIDHDPYKASAYFVLANAYALMGDYNRSLTCYNNAIAIDPDWDWAKFMRHSVICHHKEMEKLLVLDRSIQDVLVQLKEFQELQDEWLKFHEEIIHQQAVLNTSDSIHLKTEPENKNQRNNLRRKEGSKMLSSDITPRINFVGHNIDGDIASLQAVYSTVESKAQKISEKINHPTANHVHHLSSSKSKSDQIEGHFRTFERNSKLANSHTFCTNEY